MKVEFLEFDTWGPALFISGADFLKAQKSNAELESLEHATTAFANMFGIDYTINHDEYDASVSALEKGGTVIFTIGSARYPDRRWVEIQVSNNNQPKRVMYMDDDGYHLIRRCHFNPKAMAAIKKRKEADRNA